MWCGAYWSSWRKKNHCKSDNLREGLPSSMCRMPSTEQLQKRLPTFRGKGAERKHREWSNQAPIMSWTLSSALSLGKSEMLPPKSQLLTPTQVSISKERGASVLLWLTSFKLECARNMMPILHHKNTQKALNCSGDFMGYVYKITK